jgi:hypothetical protein
MTLLVGATLACGDVDRVVPNQVYIVTGVA